MLLNGALLLILCICFITDVANRKIYNKVVFPGIILALIIHFFSDGWAGLGFSVGGFAIGLLLLLIPYLLGGMGAGDVKLLALIGAFKGTIFVVTTAIYMALLGGLIALLILMVKRGIGNSIRSLIINFWCIRNGWILPFRTDKSALATTYPYGVAIVGGALITLYAKGMEYLW
ncbi:A24 family peptidase [Brevibacillus sp. SYSU BS000544]|uniref:A24 family peptidase n=1 Tax=Brevibacillus sp. SYSU BS000544 TaxID=3416443 RepID=UPI003CE59F52